MLKYYTYDNLTKKEDYPVEKAFEKIYSTTEDLLIMFPNQIILSQKPNLNEVSLSNIKEVGTQYEFPDGTYAYTTLDDQVYFFGKPVSIESFWLRLHRSNDAFRVSEVAYRTVRVFLGNILVAEQ